MHIGMTNCINSTGNKAKFKTKLTKLFIHKLVAKESIAITFSFAGLKASPRTDSFTELKKGKAKMVSDWQEFY